MSAKTASLHEACKRLAEEEAKARNAVDKIQKPLAVFDSYYLLAERMGLRPDAAEAADAASALENCKEAYRRASAPLPAGGAATPAYPHRVTPFPSAPLTPFDADFPPALDRMDEAIGFLATHATFKDAAPFLSKFRNLQAQALGAVKTAATEAIERTVASATGELKKVGALSSGAAAGVTGGQQRGSPNASPLASPASAAISASALEAAEVSQLQVRFRTELVHLRRLLQLLEARASKRTYADLVRAVHKSYLDARLGLVADVTRVRLAKIIDGFVNRGAAAATSSASAPSSQPQLQIVAAATAAAATLASDAKEERIIEAVRAACVSMAATQVAEHALFHSLFIAPSPTPAAAYADEHAQSSSTAAAAAAAGAHAMPTHVRTAADAALSAMQEDLCAVLVDALRPVFLSTGSLDTLCRVIVVLRDEVVRELAAPRGPSLAAFVRVVLALNRDAQERLIFRAGGYISECIEGYVPSKAVTAIALIASAGGGAGVPIALSDGRTGSVIGVKVYGDGDYPGAILSFYLRQRSAALAAAAASSAVQSSSDNGISGSAGNFNLPDPTEAWPLILRRTISLLSRLHRVIEPASFESLAQDAVVACSRILLSSGAALRSGSAAATAAGGGDRSAQALDTYAASRLVIQIAPSASSSQQQQHDAPAPLAPGTLTRGLLAGAIRLPVVFSTGATTSAAVAGDASVSGTRAFTSAMDGDLYVIKALLALREQLAGFDVALSSTTKTLDFASTAAALGALVAQLRGGSGSSSTIAGGAPSPLSPTATTTPGHALYRSKSVMSLLVSGLPTVAEVHVDGKVELESLLKAACESFIHRARLALTGSVAGLLGRHPLPYPNTSSSTVAQQTAFLRDAFATLDALYSGGFGVTLVAIRRRMGLYLGSPVTATILFKPVRDAVLGTMSAVRQHMYELSRAGEDGATSAETAELRSAVEARISGVLFTLEASDQISVDPAAAAYGYDDVLVPTSSIPAPNFTTAAGALVPLGGSGSSAGASPAAGDAQAGRGGTAAPVMAAGSAAVAAGATASMHGPSSSSSNSGTTYQVERDVGAGTGLVGSSVAAAASPDQQYQQGGDDEGVSI